MLLLVFALALAASPADDPLRLAQQLAWQKRFAEAEAAYRRILAREPRSRAAALGLGQVLLWEQRYAEAADVYRRLLPDAEARKGLATAEYWAGDFRSALRDYQLVNDAESRTAIAAIRAASAPLAAADLSFASDDQPLRRSTLSASYTFFSDPLTTWTATAGSYAFDPHATSPFAAIAGTTTFPWQHLRAGGSLRLLRFPDGHDQLLGSAGATHAKMSLDVDRHEILYTRAALRSHPSETAATLAWKDDRSEIALRAIRYFDGNSGRAADAWHLVPVTKTLSLGASASYRDTDQSRFDGRTYDPYWTPQRLSEVRAIGAATIGKVKLHLDSGWAHDRVNGSFHPWRASAAVALPFGAALTVERQSTVFYRVTSFRLTIVRRVER